MRFHYDKKVDALYIRFNNNKYRESEEVDEGIIFDYDNSGKIIGLEVLDASKKFPQGFKSQFDRQKLPITLNMVQGARA